MSLILSLETSGPHASVALHRSGNCLAEVHTEAPSQHASQLTLMAEACLKEAQCDWSHLEALAVSIGPGSYTGLRIGLSTAKGFCFGLDLPLIALNTLQIMAAALPSQGALRLPMLDARRMEVYAAIFDADLKEVWPSQALILDAHAFGSFGSQKILAFGSGSSKWERLGLPPHVERLEQPLEPRAKHMGALAHAAFLNKDWVSLVDIEPLYLKEFQGHGGNRQ